MAVLVLKMEAAEFGIESLHFRGVQEEQLGV